METRWSLRSLLRSGAIRTIDTGLELTESGRAAARRLIRSHRLWEAWLTRNAGIAPDHVHDTAMRLEHVTDVPMMDRLVEEIEDPGKDPHGRSIPE